MIKELEEEANYGETENGAVTYVSTQSNCLDLFATVGALRHASDEEIAERIIRACAENLGLALKIVFYARDIRGGLGERRVFRIALKTLAVAHADAVLKNIENIPEFGRYDDLLALIDTPCERAALEFIKAQFQKDMEVLKDPQGKVSLLGKWLPSVNTSSAQTVYHAKKIAAYLGMNDAAYRRAVVSLRARIKIIENNLREKDYTFDYSAQPSKALFKYRQAFMRNDNKRYNEFLDCAARGEAKLNTSTLTPYDIVAACINLSESRGTDEQVINNERKSLDASWNALESYAAGENALAVVDGSGSMYWASKPMPAAVAQSLGIYFAEHAQGEFRGKFITFSSKPKLVTIKGKDILEKVQYCMSYDEAADTNIEKVFKLILNTAVKHKIPQSEMPSALYIISDMEFNAITENSDVTNFENAKRMFEAAGYRLPTVVFWNVESRNSNLPVTQNESGVILVSGSSPIVFSMLRSGNFSPYDFMIDTLEKERYAVIKA